MARTEAGKAPDRLRVTYRKTAALVPYANNARTHPAAQVAQIVASIAKWGWTNPVLVDEAGGIIAGHGRVLAATELGHATVPTITLKGLTAAQKRAYVIADNKIPLNAGWDYELLKFEMLELKAEDFGLEVLGFDDLASIMLDRESGENDASAEWKNMPEFTQKDKTAFRSIPVHFKDQAALDAFAALIKQPISESTRYIWFPEIEIDRMADKQYATTAATA